MSPIPFNASKKSGENETKEGRIDTFFSEKVDAEAALQAATKASDFVFSASPQPTSESGAGTKNARASKKGLTQAEKDKVAAEKQAAKEKLAVERQAKKDAEAAERQAKKDAEIAERQAAKDKVAAEKQAEKDKLAAERQAEKDKKEADATEKKRAREQEREDKKAEKERAKAAAEKKKEEEEKAKNKVRLLDGETVDGNRRLTHCTGPENFDSSFWEACEGCC
jgi:hypothetical protein